MLFDQPMKRLLIAALPVAALWAFSGSAAAKAKAKTSGSVEVVQPWSRPAVAGTTGIGYMVLANHGAAAAVLQSVESPVASRVEMHSSAMSGGIMSMAKAERVAVPAGGRTTFGPGAYHLMFIGLTRTLKPGDELPATLTFSGGAKVKVRFAVSAGMGPPAMVGGAR